MNDRAMLANIASIELPPIRQSLVEWLRAQPPERLQEHGVGPNDIGEREFYARVVLGEYFAEQFWMLVKQGIAAGHSINVKASQRILEIKLNQTDIALTFEKRGGGDERTASFDHVVMATGHDWPEDTEISPGYFSSPSTGSGYNTDDYRVVLHGAGRTRTGRRGDRRCLGRVNAGPAELARPHSGDM